MDDLKNTKKQLDEISPSFCAAKWKQVTIHLATGLTHSCHHPSPHKIPLEEIKRNPSALHNTQFKKEQRKMMLEGVRPAECDYCWKVEDNDDTGRVFSDRITKSAEPWANDYISDIVKKPWDADANPSYLEVSFSNVCNFKCSYCGPSFSSKWVEEINEHGPFQLTSERYNDVTWLKQQDKMPIPEREENQYVDAFWHWWPSLVNDLKVFRITGGEPLLSKHTFRVLDYLIENPKPHLELNINSNLHVPDKLLDEFIAKMKVIQEKGCVLSFKLYTSCEAYGMQAEYIRTGLDYTKWYMNCRKILREIPNSHLTIMATYNALSVTSFNKFLEQVLALKQDFTVQPHRPNAVSLDVPYLRYPEFLSVWILTPDFVDLIEDHVTYMYQNMQQTYWPPLCGKGFFDYEINRMKRVFYVAKGMIKEHPNTELIEKRRKDFYLFVNEHDKRRGTNFLETFPEYRQFYELCKSYM